MSDDWAIEYDLAKEPAVVLLQHSLELAADMPHRFTAEDFESLEAFWTHFDSDFMSAGYIVNLSDGRRFNLTYDFGQKPEDEPDAAPTEVLKVTQMAEGEHPPVNIPSWDYDVHAINSFMWETPLAPEAVAAERPALH